MSISISINKEGKASVWGNPDFNTSKDVLHFKEVVLVATETEVTCYGVLTSNSVGVGCSKDKDWKPDGAKVTYRVFAKEKQQWDKEAGKFVTAAVHRDENLLHKILSDVCKTFPEKAILTGNITPWINPYFWELDAGDESNLPLLQKLTSQVESLRLAIEPFELSETEIATALETSSYSGKKGGTYAKAETESERLNARLVFFKEQLADLFEFTTLYDLAGQVEASKANSGQISPAQMTENSVATTLELLSIIAGN